MFKYNPHPFPKEIELEVYHEQGGICCVPGCGKKLDLRIDRPDHIVPQSKTNIRIYGKELIHSKENCQIPCWHHHQTKATWSKEKEKELKEEWEPYSKSKLKDITLVIAAAEKETEAAAEPQAYKNLDQNIRQDAI